MLGAGSSAAEDGAPVGEPAPDPRPALEAALLALDVPAVAGGRVAARAHAYRAELLRRLGRRREAAEAYATALEATLDDPGAVDAGLRDLLHELGGLEQVVILAPRACARHPGRAWQWEPLGAEARRRLALEASAPIDASGLEALRAEVARRLEDAPCAHDDDRRPVTEAAAASLGMPVRAVLAWLGELGGCCCDCAVVGVRGPRG